MSGELADIYVTLRMVTSPFAKGAAEASEEGEALGKKVGGLGSVMSKLGQATVMAGAGIAVASVKMAGDFQASMTKLVTSAGEAPARLKQVSNGILDLAVQTGTSTKELASGMYMVESAGFHGANGLTVLKAAAEGARAEGAPLQDMANAVTSALKSYAAGAGQATNYTNMMVAAVGHGKTTMSDFSSSLSTVLPVAAAAHVSFAQMAGAIATMTNHGTSAQEATHELANTIRALQAPNNVAVKEMNQFGISSVDVATHLGSRGLTGTLELLTKTITSKMGPSGTILLKTFYQSTSAAKDAQTMIANLPPAVQKIAKAYQAGHVSLAQWRDDLKSMPANVAANASQFATLTNKAHGFNDFLRTGSPAAQTYTDALKKMMGGATGMNTALMLTGSNLSSFKSNVAAVGAAGQKSGKDVNGWAEITKTFNFQMSQLRERVETTAIKIGTKLIPVVLAVVGYFSKNKDAAEALAIVIGVVLGAAVLTYAAKVAMMVGKTVKGFYDVGASAVSGAKTAVGATKDFVSGLRNVDSAIADNASRAARAGAAIRSQIASWGEAASSAGSKVAEGFSKASSAVSDVSLKWATAGKEMAASATTWVTETAAKVWTVVSTNIAGAASAAAAWIAANAVMLAGIALIVIVVVAAVLLIIKYHRQIWAAVVQVWHDIEDAVTAVVSAVVGFVEDHWQLLLAILLGPIALAVLGIKTYWSDIEHWFDVGIKEVARLLTWWTGLPLWFARVLADAASAVGHGVDSIANWVAGLPGRLLSVLDGLYNDMLGVGRNVMVGLWNGIVGMGNWLYNQLIGLIKDVIPGPILKVLGIASPSKLTTYYGQMVGQGLAEGIKSQYTAVGTAMAGMAQVVAGTKIGAPQIGAASVGTNNSIGGLAAGLGGIGGLGAGSLGLGGSGAVVVVNHNYNIAGTVVAEKQLMDLVQKNTLRRARRNGANNLSIPAGHG